MSDDLNVSTPDSSEVILSSQQHINSFENSHVRVANDASFGQHDIGSSNLPTMSDDRKDLITANKKESTKRVASNVPSHNFSLFRGSSHTKSRTRHKEGETHRQVAESKFIVQLHKFTYAKNWSERIAIVLSFLQFFYIGFRPRYVWKEGVIGSVVEYHGRSLNESEDYKVWMGLFLDLIYVALMALLTTLLDSCAITFVVLAYSYGILTIFYNSRFIFDEYNIRFSQDDFYHRFMYFLYILSIMFMCIFTGLDHRFLVTPENSHSRRLGGAANVDTFVCYVDNNGYYSRFGYAFYFNRSVLITMYVVSIIADQSGKAYEQFSSRILATLASIIMYIISDVAVDSSMGKVIFLVFLAELDVIFVYVTILSKTYFNFSWMQLHYPVPYLQIQERNGTFLLVVFGEIVISFISFANGSFTNEIIKNSVFGLALVFSFATTYFDSVQRMEGEIHASRRHIIAGYTHAVPVHKMLGFFLLILSTGVINYTDSSGIYYLAYGCSGTAFTLLIAKILHRGFIYRFKTIRRTFFTLLSCGVAASHLSLQRSTIGFSNTLMVHCFLAVSRIVIDIIYSVLHDTTPEEALNAFDDDDNDDYSDDDDDHQAARQMQNCGDLEADMYRHFTGGTLDRINGIEKINKVHAELQVDWAKGGGGAGLLSPNSKMHQETRELASSAGLSLAHHAHYRSEAKRRRTQMKRLSRARNCDATAGVMRAQKVAKNAVAQALQHPQEEA